MTNTALEDFNNKVLVTIIRNNKPIDVVKPLISQKQQKHIVNCRIKECKECKDIYHLLSCNLADRPGENEGLEY